MVAVFSNFYQRGKRFIPAYQISVNFIGYDNDSIFPADPGDIAEIAARKNPAAGIMGITENEYFVFRFFGQIFKFIKIGFI